MLGREVVERQQFLRIIGGLDDGFGPLGPVGLREGTSSAPGKRSIEATFTSTTGTLVVYGYEDGPLEDLPTLTPYGPGTYHLRLHNQGRAHAQALDTTDPDDDSGEYYLLQTWPSTGERPGTRPCAG
ncbi:hypothetical protein ACFYVL_40105 [Streptomyces sp. NPDC004111]|uniref:hypothetical protein n=1 Tax=Streptomyces sp. NPDC004111 TaxID=3364690 RepID=UPI0036989246